MIISSLMMAGQTAIMNTRPVATPGMDQSSPQTTARGMFELKELKPETNAGLPYTQTDDQIATPASPWIPTGLTSEFIVSTKVESNSSGLHFVDVTFNPEGAKLFEAVTARNIGRPLGIFVDGTLISAPQVNEKISGGTARISGNFTLEEAQQLANRLNPKP